MEKEKFKPENTEMQWRPIKKVDIAFVDALVEVTKNIPRNAQIEGDVAWRTLDKVVALWSKRYPGEAEAYWQATKEIRETRWDQRHAATKNKSLRYLSLIPDQLYFIIKRVFPEHRWTKEFARMFVERYRAFKVPKKI